MKASIRNKQVKRKLTRLFHISYGCFFLNVALYIANDIIGKTRK